MRASLIAFIAPFALMACATAESPTGAASPAIAAAAPASAAIEVPSGEYAIDKSHASVLWRVNHLGLSMYTGRFNVFDAKLNFNAETPEASTLEVTIEAASVDTGFQYLGRNSDFNAEIANAALGAEKAPQITFRSTAVTRTGAATGTVTGDLTLNGVTKPTTLAVTFYGGKPHPFTRKPTLGFAARGTIKRSEWGVQNWSGPVADEVEIIVEAEFGKS